jgi:hypothetical protein
MLLRVFVAVGTCLPSRCLVTKGGMRFTGPLHSRDKRDTDTHGLMRGIYEVRH